MKALLLAILAPSIALAGPLDRPAQGGSNSSLNQGSQRASPYSPDQLVALYEKNAIAANTQLAGKVITLSGRVDQIETDAIFFTPQKRLTYTDIRCEISKEDAAAFAKLKLGSRIVITGTVAEMKYSQITLTGCKPAKP